MAADRRQLEDAGYALAMLREAPTFAEAEVRRGAASTLIQWARDSAFRFFPLVEDEELGLALHPFDLATNKALAMAGRLEARDWVDLLTSVDRIQPLGFLAWAACGKDPGFNPLSLLQEMRRSGRYPQAVLDRLDLGGERLDAQVLGERWRQQLTAADAVCEALPVEAIGACVVSTDSELFRGDLEALRAALASGQLRYHHGTIGGAWPSFPSS